MWTQGEPDLHTALHVVKHRVKHTALHVVKHRVKHIQ